GGIESGKSRINPDEQASATAKPLETNKPDEATLQADRSLKTRLDQTKQDEKARATALRQSIVKAFEDANSPNLPDTSRAELWLSQGYDPAIVAATVRT